ncbi:MAG: glutamyl-tRNA reductase, partial [Hymenobacteraceae bacterium]|nr:glutamyl-tRNA reductase [Hymenobacteraceae bacterium]
MSFSFKAVTLSHRLAPLAIREQVALDEIGCQRLLLNLKEELTELGATDLFVISTCNRTEVYYAAPTDLTDRILAALAREKRLPAIEHELRPYFTSLLDSDAATQHLFEVGLGLDAQVVGDLQITGQVKQAYQWAADADTAGPLLHRLLHTIFFANKRVVQETAFRHGAASTSYATVELVEELTAVGPAPRVLVVGLGELGADVVRNLHAAGFEHLTLTNRTRAKADALAIECPGVTVIDFEELTGALAATDVIISSIAAPTPFFNVDVLRYIPVVTFKYFIDLAVPRSVAPEAETIPGILVYNLDTIQQRATRALELRLAAVPHVRQIIAESLAGFSDWSRELLVSPAIQKFKNTLEQLRQEGLDRYQRRQLPPEEMKRLDEATRALLQKILKLPVVQLKAACRRGDADILIDTLTELFDLERTAVAG